ncbi:hypothetical protein HXZ66_05060 [Bacillus sp. A116_S68]|nr:hypothetical protein HXZ66_05060 [Bacillus sp. A116_S68]
MSIAKAPNQRHSNEKKSVSVAKAPNQRHSNEKKPVSVAEAQISATQTRRSP